MSTHTHLCTHAPHVGLAHLCVGPRLVLDARGDGRQHERSPAAAICAPPLGRPPRRTPRLLPAGMNRWRWRWRCCFNACRCRCGIGDSFFGVGRLLHVSKPCTPPPASPLTQCKPGTCARVCSGTRTWCFPRFRRVATSTSIGFSSPSTFSRKGGLGLLFSGSARD